MTLQGEQTVVSLNVEVETYKVLNADIAAAQDECLDGVLVAGLGCTVQGSLTLLQYKLLSKIEIGLVLVTSWEPELFKLSRFKI